MDGFALVDGAVAEYCAVLEPVCIIPGTAQILGHISLRGGSFRRNHDLDAVVHTALNHFSASTTR